MIYSIRSAMADGRLGMTHPSGAAMAMPRDPDRVHRPGSATKEGTLGAEAVSEQTPARVERDGPLATIVVDSPPLNHFRGAACGGDRSGGRDLQRPSADLECEGRHLHGRRRRRRLHRAQRGRWRQFHGLFTAETLERWNVVNRVLPAGQLSEQATRFAERLANGPTVAHGVTKQITAAVRRGGAGEADRITGEAIGPLFETDDLRNAVESFLAEGPGKATFEGK